VGTAHLAATFALRQAQGEREITPKPFVVSLSNHGWGYATVKEVK